MRRPEKNTSAVFGVPIDHTLQIAGITLPMSDDEGQRITIPAVVEECARFIIAKGTNPLPSKGPTHTTYDPLTPTLLTDDSADLAPAEATRIRSLRSTFGSGHSASARVWESCNVQDACSLLSAYLAELPDPVIPFSHYVSFRTPLQVKASSPLDVDAVIPVYQALVAGLPTAHRHLLLHLLDVFATLGVQGRYTLRNILAVQVAPAVLRVRGRGRFGRVVRELLLPGDDSLSVLMFLVKHAGCFAVVDDDDDDDESDGAECVEEAMVVSVVGAVRRCANVVEVGAGRGRSPS